MSSFETLTSAQIRSARQIRVVTLTEEEVFQRAREAFIFTHPRAPAFVRRMARSGKLDFMLAAARQAMRDIEKPIDLLTHEARAAWVLNIHRDLMAHIPDDAKAAVAQLAVTAIRVGTKDCATPPHAVIHGSGPLILAAAGIAAVIAALVVVF